MNKHYKKALIEATVENLENHGIENPSRETLTTIVEDPEKWDEVSGDDYSFEGDIECLTDLYLRETTPSPEEQVEEILNKLHVGMNFVPGIGFGYCKDEDDLESMKEWLKDRILAAILLAKISEEDTD